MSVYSSADWTPISLTRNGIQRAYEPFQIYFFTQLAEVMGARSFCDVGANIGSFTVAMARLATLERIHSFEPMPPLHAELAKNASRNDPAGKIRLHQLAVSDQAGSAEFVVMGNYSGANGIATTIIHDMSRMDRKIAVPTSTLDQVVETAGNLPEWPCFIKIDVEGHELAVLNGAHNLLQRPCVLQIESYDPQGTGQAITGMLQDHGYKVFWQIGADTYYAKAEICPTQAQLLDVISGANTAMIADFQAIGPYQVPPNHHQHGNPIERRLGPVQIHLFDPLARFFRAALGRG